MGEGTEFLFCVKTSQNLSVCFSGKTLFFGGFVLCSDLSKSVFQKSFNTQ